MRLVNHSRNKAESFIIYTIILALIIGIVLAMNSYLKGGFAGSMEQFTNRFVSKQRSQQYDAAPKNVNQLRYQGEYPQVGVSQETAERLVATP